MGKNRWVTGVILTPITGLITGRGPTARGLCPEVEDVEDGKTRLVPTVGGNLWPEILSGQRWCMYLSLYLDELM